LTVDGAQLTLSLDGGTAVAFTPGDANVRVTNPSGAVVYVDTSALVAGFSGDVSLEGQGTLSIDDGMTETVLDFSENQMLIDSRTGHVTFLDTRNVRQTGVELIEYPGTTDTFQALIDLREELRNSRELQPGQWQEAMQRRVADLQRVHDHLLHTIGEQSVSLENLDALQSRLEAFQLEAQRSVADVESVDITEAVLNMQAEQNALQFTYAVTVQLMNTSLLDFLR
jgi:flagellin-like hook-associated protein FlgL